jgi:hypothetical protein
MRNEALNHVIQSENHMNLDRISNILRSMNLNNILDKNKYAVTPWLDFTMIIMIATF